MAIESSMLALGTKAPDFKFLETFSDKKALLVMFICRHCPYVKHVQDELAKIGKDYADEQSSSANKDIGIIAISSNDIEAYPEDAPDSLKEQAKEVGFTFPYLFDESQEIAKAYTAACTPDFFLFDKDRKLVYRGQLDDSRPGSDIPVTGKDLRAAIAALLNDQQINSDQKPSIGCGIKWKTNN